LEDDRLITKNIINLSPTGMAFKAPSSSDISPGQNLRFTLSIVPGEAFECEARVLWVKPAHERPESGGSMRKVGVEFSKLPPTLDAAIVKQINEFVLRSRRQRIEAGRRPFTRKIVLSTPPSMRSAVNSLLAAIVIAALSGAFVMAMWIHQKSTPDDSIARKFDEGLLRKLSSEKDR
jgi:hypothetical protein